MRITNCVARSTRACSLAAALVVLFAAGFADGQDRRRQGYDKASLEAGYKQKLELPFVGKISWVRTLEEAQKLSKEKRLPIFGYFTRSYGP